jgi:hypothetical protein
MEKKYFVNDVEIPNIITIFSIIFTNTGLLLNRDQYPDIHYDSSSNYIYLSISDNKRTGILLKFLGKYDGKNINEIVIRNNGYDTIIYSKNSPIVVGTNPYVNEIPLTTDEKRLESEIIQNLQSKLENEITETLKPKLTNEITQTLQPKLKTEITQNLKPIIRNDIRNDIYRISTYRNKKFWKKYRSKLNNIIADI